MLSHVLPDLINKVLKGQNPLHILGTGDQVRCYTNGKDIAKGIFLALESPAAENEDFNISTSKAISVFELASEVWKQLIPDKKFAYVLEDGYKYDVQKRIPDVTKAQKLLNFTASITIEESIKEVVEYMTNKKLEV